MKRFEKFLFFFSILSVTVLFVSFGAMSPKPLNLIAGIALLPIVFYFWIRLTSPQAVGAEMWSFRFLLALTVLSLLGIYGFYLARSMEISPAESALKSQLSEAQRKNDELAKKLTSPSPQPPPTESGKPNIEGESIADLLNQASPMPGSVQKITSREGASSVDVYQNPDAASKKVGNLELNLNYPYLEKSDNWYKVAITSTTNGWVNSSQVQEVQ